MFSAALAFIPLDYCNDAKSQINSGNGNVSSPVAVVQLNEALADSIDQYNSFLDEMAEQAGMTPAEYIATVTGVSNIATGVSFVRDGGLVGATVGFANTTADNLGALVDAANYPDWSTLSAAQQASYGTEQAYDAAKFNSLMGAFGLDDARDRFYASGGGNFEWYNDEIEKLQQLGSIGDRWAQGLGNAYADVTGMVTDDMFFGTWLSGATLEYDGTDDLMWPSAIPRNVKFTYSNMVRLDVGDTQWYVKTSIPVYQVFFQTSANGGVVYSYYSSTFKQGLNTNSTFTPTSNPYTTGTGNEVVYYSQNSLSGITSYYIPVNYVGQSIGTADRNALLKILLYGDNKKLEPEIEDYPQTEPAANLQVYFPSSGVTNNNTWNEYTTPSEPEPEPRPENPYNPGNQTGGDEWKDDTESNVLPLLNIRFDELFPFSMLYDIPRLFEKVQATAPDYGEYDEITIPVDLPGQSMDTTIVLDLDNIANLGTMIRPFIQILLAAALLIVTIRFWQGVLTG